MRIHYLQHVPFEGPANIARWAKTRGHSMAGTELFNSRPLPTLDDFDWLVIMGGPISVHDENQFAWLRAEKKLVERAVQAGKLVLGVCLGAQLLAEVLGARVYRNKWKEIGWFPLRLTAEAGHSRLRRVLPANFLALHWHGETFDLPAGAIHLAESEGCQNQAFEFGGRALGLQFHIESTPESVKELIHNCSSDIGAGPYEQSASEMLGAAEKFASLKPLLYSVLDHMAALDQVASNER